MLTHKKPFKSMSANKLIKHAEFKYRESTMERKGSSALLRLVDRPSGFYNIKCALPLKKVDYQIDPYERKEDMLKQEYVNDSSKVLYKN